MGAPGGGFCSPCQPGASSQGEQRFCLVRTVQALQPGLSPSVPWDPGGTLPAAISHWACSSAELKRMCVQAPVSPESFGFSRGFTLAVGVSQGLEVRLSPARPLRTQVRVRTLILLVQNQRRAALLTGTAAQGYWLLRAAGRSRKGGRGVVQGPGTLWAEWLELALEVGEVLGDLTLLEPTSRPASLPA